MLTPADHRIITNFKFKNRLFLLPHAYSPGRLCTPSSNAIYPDIDFHLNLILYFCLMEVNDVLVDKLANLARLHFDEGEKAGIKNDLQKMIQFVEKLNELDTTGVLPLLHVSENINVLREDEIRGSISPEEALKNAPSHDGQFFKVPKVIKKE